MNQDEIKRLAEELFGPLQVPDVPPQADPDETTFVHIEVPAPDSETRAWW